MLQIAAAAALTVLVVGQFLSVGFAAVTLAAATLVALIAAIGALAAEVLRARVKESRVTCPYLGALRIVLPGG